LLDWSSGDSLLHWGRETPVIVSKSGGLESGGGGRGGSSETSLVSSQSPSLVRAVEGVDEGIDSSTPGTVGHSCELLGDGVVRVEVSCVAVVLEVPVRGVVRVDERVVADLLATAGLGAHFEGIAVTVVVIVVLLKVGRGNGCWAGLESLSLGCLLESWGCLLDGSGGKLLAGLSGLMDGRMLSVSSNGNMVSF